MAMGACPGQIPMPCVPPALMVTATMVRACRYTYFTFHFHNVFQKARHRFGSSQVFPLFPVNF